jgi:general secretion pathway protein B
VSFILDALRKSEHERQRSALPGLSQVPQATPAAHLPRWALVVIGALAVAVLALGAAWWQSARVPVETGSASTPTLQRGVELPPAPAPTAAPAAPPSRPPPVTATRPGAATLSPPNQTALAAAATPSPEAAEPSTAAPADTSLLPSAAMLAAQGVALPPLRLELHAFSDQPRDRFVFINGRKYVEGERLIEGPQLVSVEPRGAVLSLGGQRFRLMPE